MQRPWILLSGWLLAVTLMTGCANPPVAPTPSETPSAETQTSTPQPQISSLDTVPQSENETSNFIGEEKAKEIVLAKAGLTADGVRFEKVELDKDDGLWQYEIEFTKDRIEYDAEIKADDGTILSWDVERD